MQIMNSGVTVGELQVLLRLELLIDEMYILLFSKRESNDINDQIGYTLESNIQWSCLKHQFVVSRSGM